MSTEPREFGARKTRVHIPFYDDVLKSVEVWLLLGLLTFVIGATFLNILDRNFQLGLWEYAVVEKMVYSFTFFLGLFGGVLASRRAKQGLLPCSSPTFADLTLLRVGAPSSQPLHPPSSPSLLSPRPSFFLIQHYLNHLESLKVHFHQF